MYIIKSLKNLFFSQNDNELEFSHLKGNQEPNTILLFNNFYICFHKYIFKSNFKTKKEKEKEKTKTEYIINNNEIQNNNNSSKNIESEKENNEINKKFFYILKGAIYVIEDWWKKILIKKENKNKILHRNFINKNYQIFSDIKSNKLNLSSSKNYENYLKTDGDINNPKTIKKYIKDKYPKNNNNIYRNDKEKLKIIKTTNNSNKINILNQEQNTLDETLINSDSCFFDFTINNKTNKENKLDYVQNLNNNIISNENNKTKRDNNIIYPIKEINFAVKQDIYKNQKNINNIPLRKEIEQDMVTIPWEQNNKRISTNSLEEKYELFKEVKSKMKLDKDIISLMNNKYLLKENPFDESSIYINNSDLSQNDLIRNVNVHIMPFEIKNISLKKYCNNSNNSCTIQNDDDEISSSVLSSIYKNPKNKNNDTKNKIKKEDKNINEMKCDNIYKN